MFKQQTAFDMLKTAVGCLLFGCGFHLFLLPNGLNAGGLTGLAMSIGHFLHFNGVGLLTAAMNIPLFLLAGKKLGRRFLLGSLYGMLMASTMIELLDILPAISQDPLICALYGGIVCGLGLGIVFSTGMTTGGSDIVVRLLRKRWQEVPIGKISICFDFLVAVITGVAFQDPAKTLYSGVAIVITGMVVDAVVYRFDYSRVAMIVTRHHEQIAREIGRELNRGATFLEAQGSFSGQPVKVVLTAVKRQQLTQLKHLVTQVDPEAFVIVQEAHQVLGDGFSNCFRDA